MQLIDVYGIARRSTACQIGNDRTARTLIQTLLFQILCLRLVLRCFYSGLGGGINNIFRLIFQQVFNFEFRCFGGDGLFADKFAHLFRCQAFFNLIGRFILVALIFRIYCHHIASCNLFRLFIGKRGRIARVFQRAVRIDLIGGIPFIADFFHCVAFRIAGNVFNLTDGQVDIEFHISIGNFPAVLIDFIHSRRLDLGVFAVGETEIVVRIDFFKRTIGQGFTTACECSFCLFPVCQTHVPSRIVDCIGDRIASYKTRAAIICCFNIRSGNFRIRLRFPVFIALIVFTVNDDRVNFRAVVFGYLDFVGNLAFFGRHSNHARAVGGGASAHLDAVAAFKVHFASVLHDIGVAVAVFGRYHPAHTLQVAYGCGGIFIDWCGICTCQVDQFFRFRLCRRTVCLFIAVRFGADFACIQHRCYADKLSRFAV